MKTIISIVEGYGEVTALPILLRGLRPEVTFHRPWNTKGRFKIVKEGELERLLELVRIQHKSGKCDGVLILQDADEDCPVEVAMTLAARAIKLQLPFPVAIVYAKCEYEAWFLASLETLRGKYGLPANVTFPEDKIEQIRGAKEWLAKHMPQDRGYSETRDQPAMTSLIDFDLVRKRCRSFQRLEHALEELLSGSAIVTPTRPR